MEPQIRYVRSADGTKIAAASVGSGPPLVLAPPTYGHIEAYFAVPEARGTIDYLAERHRVVTYDPRGRGLSDRTVTDWSLEARVADLLAVFEGLSLPPAYLLGRAFGSPAAIAFTARNPERVMRLGLYAGMARGADLPITDEFRAIFELLQQRWELHCQFTALLTFHWTESGRIFAQSMTTAFTAEGVRKYLEAVQVDDAGDCLEQVQCPTLLIQPRRPGAVGTISPEATREMATRMGDVRVRTSDFPEWASLLFDEDDIKAFAEFFDEDGSAPRQAAPALTGTAVVLFADIADSTALTERLGDAAFREKARALDEALRKAITANGGTPIEGKLLGDGVLATFGAAREAIACAQELHRLAAGVGGGRDPRPSTPDPLLLHVGIHAGDVIREEGNVFGGAVNIASRVAGEADAGETLVSATVRDLARTSAGVSFEDRGERELKGVSEPVRVFCVKEQGTGNKEQG